MTNFDNTNTWLTWNFLLSKFFNKFLLFLMLIKLSFFYLKYLIPLYFLM